MANKMIRLIIDLEVDEKADMKKLQKTNLEKMVGEYASVLVSRQGYKSSLLKDDANSHSCSILITGTCNTCDSVPHGYSASQLKK